MAEGEKDINPNKLASWKESSTFWKHASRATWASAILFVVSFLIFYQSLSAVLDSVFHLAYGGGYFSIFMMVLMVLYLYLYIPSMPGVFGFYFRGKTRKDLTEAEYREGSREYGLRSLDLYSVAFIVISLAFIALYYLDSAGALPESLSVILMAVAVFDVFMITTLIVPRRGYGWGRLSKILTEEGYVLYTSFKKKIRVMLVAFNVLAIALLAYALLAKPSLWQSVILVSAIVANTFLAWFAWYYADLNKAEEAEQKFARPKMGLAIAVLVAFDLAFAAWLVVKTAWPATPFWTMLIVATVAFVLGLIFAFPALKIGAGLVRRSGV